MAQWLSIRQADAGCGSRFDNSIVLFNPILGLHHAAQSTDSHCCLRMWYPEIHGLQPDYEVQPDLNMQTVMCDSIATVCSFIHGMHTPTSYFVYHNNSSLPRLWTHVSSHLHAAF